MRYDARSVRDKFAGDALRWEQILRLGRFNAATNFYEGPKLRGLSPLPAPEPKTMAQAEALPVPRGAWPKWAIELERRAKPGEFGVGDTARMVFGYFGGEQFKAAAKAAGINCGCCERQARWNQNYPYPKKEQT